MIAVVQRVAHMAFAVVIALGLGCGGDSPSTPNAAAGPGATPAPTPSPPAPASPRVQSLVITTAPFDPRGYVVGEIIEARVLFSEAVVVSGSPRLAIGIGEHLRQALWDEDASLGPYLAFRYRVTLEDRDEDGISVAAAALAVQDGEIKGTNGVEADLDIAGHAIADDGDHLVLGAPPERVCGDERSVALRATPTVVDEWTGAPSPVNMVRNFPDFVPDGYLESELDAIGRLADQIEEQLGYRILERGALIDVPAGTPAGWDRDFDRYWRTNPLPRERGQILAIYLDDDNEAWEGEGSPMSAHPCCGTTSYNRRFFRAPHWTGWTGANSPDGEAIVHEVFHLLGFKHSFDQQELIGVEMSRGGLDRPWTLGAETYYASWTDIDNLRCIFPQGG